MDTSLSEINPYAPPLEPNTADWPILPPQRYDEVHFSVRDTFKFWIDRRIWLTGTGDYEIHYEASSTVGEIVRVNGEIQGRGSPWDLSLVSPVIEFTLDGPGYRIPARIDVKLGFSWLSFFRLRTFRLTVAGKVVYEE